MNHSQLSTITDDANTSHQYQPIINHELHYRKYWTGWTGPQRVQSQHLMTSFGCHLTLIYLRLARWQCSASICWSTCATHSVILSRILCATSSLTETVTCLQVETTALHRKSNKPWAVLCLLLWWYAAHSEVKRLGNIQCVDHKSNVLLYQNAVAR